MNILVAYTRFPWPTIRGDQLTVYKLLEFLAKNHNVDLLCSLPERSEYEIHLPKTIKKACMVNNPMHRRMYRVMVALMKNRCIQIDSFFSKEYNNQRAKLLAENNYDIIYSHYIRSFGHENFNSYNAKKVIGLQLSHQAHFAKAALNASNPITKILYAIEAKRLAHWEGAVASYNDLIHIISKKDLKNIKGFEKWSNRVFINPHGVDETIFVPAPQKKAKGRVVFTGNLSFQANEDAITWFIQHTWPIIVNAKKDASLMVAGSNPTSKVKKAVELATNATLVANPENMWEIIQTADVAIDPLRIGAGLQNKILESLSCGVPVVSTSLGNEGIQAAEEQEILIANESSEFASSVIRVLKEKEIANKLSAAGRSFIIKSWSWEHHFIQLENRWQQLLNENSCS